MIQRIKQFLRAANASLSADDITFVKSHLNEAQQKLFFNMNLFDQRHVLNVSYTALHLQRTEGLKIDKELLIKACLLHDIARTKDGICIWDKVFCVLMAHFLPRYSRSLADSAKKLLCIKTDKLSFIQKHHLALYIYYNHAQLGAEKLRSLNMDEIAAVIAHHHEAPQKGDCNELVLLRRADELN